jgi:hypothetical protein
VRDCQRCGAEVSWSNDTCKLFGEVYAHLCNPCRTEFDGVVRSQPLWARFLALKARESYYDSLATGQYPVDEARWTALIRDLDDVEREAHAFGVRWVSTLVAAQAKDEG